MNDSVTTVDALLNWLLVSPLALALVPFGFGAAMLGMYGYLAWKERR